MISAAGMMQPLPVRPVDGPQDPAPTPQPRAATGRMMQPLPVPTPDSGDLVDAIRDAAFARMLDRLGVQHPLPVVDPTA